MLFWIVVTEYRYHALQILVLTETPKGILRYTLSKYVFEQFMFI